jgi:hypothetical protein
MTAQHGRRPVKMSRLSLALAAGSSGTVAAAAVSGHDCTGPEVGAAFAMAGVIVAANLGHEPEAQPHVFQRVTKGSADVAVISAPRARTLAAHPTGHSDAA